MVRGTGEGVLSSLWNKPQPGDNTGYTIYTYDLERAFKGLGR
jgi:hypothetical protein